MTNVFGLNLGSVSGAQGTLTIDNGGQLSDNANDSTKRDVLGYAAGSSGAATVDGDGSNWTSTGKINVGYLGEGSLTVSDGGSIDALNLIIGNNSSGPASGGGSGTALIESGGSVTTTGPWDEIGDLPGRDGRTHRRRRSGSNWTSAGKIDVGYLGEGSLTVSNGGSIDALNLIIGNNSSGPASGSGSGTALIESGGSVTTTGPWDEIGAYQGATGALTVDGDGSNWTSAGKIDVGDLGEGSLTVSNGGRIDALDLIIGNNSSGPASGSGSGTALIESGGSVTTTGPWEQIGAYQGATGALTVDGDGSNWTSAGKIDVGDLGEGSLTVSNGGRIDALDLIIGNNSSGPAQRQRLRHGPNRERRLRDHDGSVGTKSESTRARRAPSPSMATVRTGRARARSMLDISARAV